VSKRSLCVNAIHDVSCAESRLAAGRLAAGNAGDVLAAGAGFATGELDARPSPVRAGTRGAQNVDIGSGARDGPGNLAHLQVGDGNTAGGGASGAAVLVVLLNDNTVLGDAAQGDVGVVDVVNLYRDVSTQFSLGSSRFEFGLPCR
jgi:hypothetical protein